MLDRVQTPSRKMVANRAQKVNNWWSWYSRSLTMYKRMALKMIAIAYKVHFRYEGDDVWFWCGSSSLGVDEDDAVAVLLW